MLQHSSPTHAAAQPVFARLSLLRSFCLQLFVGAPVSRGSFLILYIPLTCKHDVEYTR